MTISYSPTENSSSTVTPRDSGSSLERDLATCGDAVVDSKRSCKALTSQGFGSVYSTSLGALKASSLSIILDSPTLTCSSLRITGTGTTIAKSLTSP